MRNRYFTVVLAVASTMVLLAAVSPVEAQSGGSALVDRFSLKLEGSWVALNTQIRLDSEAFGRGTTLDIESDLGLGENKIVPTLDFAWHITRKHTLAPGSATVPLTATEGPVVVSRNTCSAAPHFGHKTQPVVAPIR